MQKSLESLIGIKNKLYVLQNEIKKDNASYLMKFLMKFKKIKRDNPESIFRYLHLYYISWIKYKIEGDFPKIDSEYKETDPEAYEANNSLVERYKANACSPSITQPPVLSIQDCESKSIIHHHEYAVLSREAYRAFDRINKKTTFREVLVEPRDLKWNILAKSSDLLSNKKSKIRYFAIAYFQTFRTMLLSSLIREPV